jgi:hypothetical protein
MYAPCVVQPTAVQGYLREFTDDALSSVRQAAASQATPLPQLSLRAIATALFGRRAVDPGGPSEFDILEPLMKCDTKSYPDGVKIEKHLGSHSGPARVVDVAIGDGQSVILWKNLKVRHRPHSPHTHARTHVRTHAHLPTRARTHAHLPTRARTHAHLPTPRCVGRCNMRTG